MDTHIFQLNVRSEGRAAAQWPYRPIGRSPWRIWGTYWFGTEAVRAADAIHQEHPSWDYAIDIVS